jgi:hypothetical protein
MTFTNEGTWDRIIRILAAVALGYAAWVTWPGAASAVMLVIGAIALVTGLVGWCALYAFLGISTRKQAGA